MSGRGIRFLLVVIAWVSVACAPADDPAPEVPAPLVVASDFDHPPFAAWKEGAGPVGLEPELVGELAARLGRPIQWKRIPFDGLLDEVSAGRVDLVAATLGITDERRKIVAFSRPYFRTEIAVVVRDADGPEDLAGLEGRRVGAARGTTSEAALYLFLPRSEAVLERKGEETLADMLAGGTIDAAAMDGPDADELVRTSGGALRRLTEVLADEHYAFAMAPGDADLVADVDRVLEELEADGTLAGLIARRGL